LEWETRYKDLAGGIETRYHHVAVSSVRPFGLITCNMYPSTR